MNANPLFLLVDDDLDDLALLKYSIHSIDSRIRFEEASDGQAALRYLREIQDRSQLPSLVVMDINMPGLNGRELLTILKSEDHLKHLPIVVCSSLPFPGDIDYCKLFNVDLVPKPFGMKELIEFSRKLIAYSN